MKSKVIRKDVFSNLILMIYYPFTSYAFHSFIKAITLEECSKNWYNISFHYLKSRAIIFMKRLSLNKLFSLNHFSLTLFLHFYKKSHKKWHKWVMTKNLLFHMKSLFMYKNLFTIFLYVKWSVKYPVRISWYSL